MFIHCLLFIKIGEAYANSQNTFFQMNIKFLLVQTPHFEQMFDFRLGIICTTFSITSILLLVHQFFFAKSISTFSTNFSVHNDKIPHTKNILK